MRYNRGFRDVTRRCPKGWIFQPFFVSVTSIQAASLSLAAQSAHGSHR